MSKLPRARIGAALVVAFLCGLVFASGFDLTRFSWAQTRVTPATNPAPKLGSALDIQNDFEAVVDKVKPAVVTVRVERYAQAKPAARRGGNGNAPQGQNVPPNIQDFLRQFGGGSPDETPDDQGPMQGSGSGFIVRSDGYILTNNHVVANVDKVQVYLVDHREFDAKVIGRDPTTDVAVIKIDATNLPTVTMGDDANARVGQWALAIGNPLDLDFTVTAGIVSAKGRNVSGLANPGGYNISDYIQTDAAINPGNSGGPLVNIRGEVIGINSAIETPTGYYTGYGFAIPITLAEEVMNDLINVGHVRRAILGVGINEVTPEDAQAAGLKTIGGAKVGGYSPDPVDAGTSPAGRAGVKPGDIIIAAAGKPVDQVSTLQRIIRGYQPGQTVDVEVMRFGKDMHFKITLAEQPADSSTVATTAAPATTPFGGRNRGTPAPTEEMATHAIDRLGLSVTSTANTGLFQQYQVGAPPAAYRDGLAIASVDERGPNAAKVGPTEIITKEMYPVEHDIKTQADLDAALSSVKSGGVITLMIAGQSSTGWQSGPITLRVK